MGTTLVCPYKTSVFDLYIRGDAQYIVKRACEYLSGSCLFLIHAVIIGGTVGAFLTITVGLCLCCCIFWCCYIAGY